MRHSLQVRAARQSDAERLAVLAIQVWLHTYCTNGINEDVAQYVLSELTVEKFLDRLKQPENKVLVAEREEWLVGFAAVRFGA